MKEKIVISNKKTNEEMTTYWMEIGEKIVGIEGSLEDLAGLFNAIWIFLSPEKDFWEKLRIECPNCNSPLKLSILDTFEGCKECDLKHEHHYTITLEERGRKKGPKKKSVFRRAIFTPIGL